MTDIGLSTENLLNFPGKYNTAGIY